MTTRVITLWRVHITSLTMYVAIMCFLIEKIFILKAIKFNFKESYEKQNFNLVVISFLVSLISYKITIRVRSSIYGTSPSLPVLTARSRSVCVSSLSVKIYILNSKGNTKIC